MFLNLVRFVFCLILLSGLTACSPAFNWREVPNNELGYVATFPDKPVSATRELNLDGLKVPLTLHAAKVGEVYFTVGLVPLDETLTNNLDRLTLALAQSLGNNIGVQKVELIDKDWQGTSARFFDASGKMPNQEGAKLQGYFVRKNGYLFEVVLMGPESQVSDVVVTQWFTGFKWLRK